MQFPGGKLPSSSEAVQTAATARDQSKHAPPPSPLPDASMATTPHEVGYSFGASPSSSGIDVSGGKQRRRRTSPEDQVVLEVAFAENPKPDKMARAEIVARVTMGQKEVQIWFQNRRQMARRRSQLPQQQHAGPEHPYPSQECANSSVPSTDSGAEREGATPKSSRSSVVERCRDASLPTDVVKQAMKSNIDASDERLGSTQTAGEASADGRGLPLSNASATPSSDSTGAAPPNNHEGTSNDSPSLGIPLSGGSKVPAFHIRSPRRRVSNVRLSLTLEGKAQVTEAPISSSASLPRSKPRPPFGLQRSQSAIEPKPKPSADFVLPTLSNLGRGRPGRSRDARTWEFFCDGGDAQDALTKRAEGEQAGSAASAIRLIRQNSASALKMNATKRNAGRDRDDSCKRLKSGVKLERQKLSRAQSSLARLQSVISDKPDSKPGRSSVPDPWASGDSDKENWLPGTTEAPPRRVAPAPQVAGMSRGVLKENTHLASHASSLDSLLDSAKNTPKRQRTPKKIHDLDVFDDGTSNSQDAEDLDCIQGLLSLSQGAWQ